MNFRLFRHFVLFAAVTAILLSTSCDGFFNFGPALTETTTTTGFVGSYHPTDQTNVFYIDSPQICCSAKLSAAQPGTEVKANWVYVRGEMPSQTKPLIRTDLATCDGDCYVGFTWAAPPEGYTGGDYRVDLSINGKPATSLIFYIQHDQEGALPAISSFTASPPSVVAGQPSNLKWNVSNATRVTVEPSPGAVALTGVKAITPAADATYTLWAVNRRGASSNALTVKVAPLISKKADLVIVDFWNAGNMLFYNVRNVGNLASCTAEGQLYKNDVLASRDYVAPLNPGEERVESFGSYHFSPRFPSILGSTVGEGTTDTVNIRICVNDSAACPESDSTNNCFEHNFGTLLIVHLEHYAYLAQWQCSTGKLVWPMLHDTRGAWARVAAAQVDDSGIYPDSLIMAPLQDASSWMEARIGLPGGPTQGLQPFYIPHKCKINAKVGLTRETPDATSVKFIFGTMQGSEINYYPPVTIDSKDKPADYEIDLSKLAGKQVLIILRVESSGSLQQGSAVWIDPTLVQER